MKLVRTVVVFVIGVVVGYTIQSWDIELPKEVETYARELRQMKHDKQKLEAELRRLRSVLGES